MRCVPGERVASRDLPAMNDEDDLMYDESWDGPVIHCPNCGSYELSAAVDAVATCFECGASVPLE